MAVHRDNLTEHTVVAHIKKRRPYADRSIIPLLQAFQTSGWQKLDGKRTSYDRTINKGVNLVVSNERTGHTAHTVGQFVWNTVMLSPRTNTK